MGGKSRPSGPSAADTRKQMQGYWQNVQTWRNDINQRYNRQLATTRTRMAAGGIKTGTDEWNRQLKSLEEGRAKALKDIEAGATYQQLSSWAQGQQRARQRATQRSGTGAPHERDFMEKPVSTPTPRHELDFMEKPMAAKPTPRHELDFMERVTDKGAGAPQSGEQSPLLSVDEYLESQFGTFSGTSGGGAPTGDARGRRAAASGAGQRLSPWWG